MQIKPVPVDTLNEVLREMDNARNALDAIQRYLLPIYDAQQLPYQQRLDTINQKN